MKIKYQTKKQSLLDYLRVNGEVWIEFTEEEFKNFYRENCVYIASYGKDYLDEIWIKTIIPQIKTMTSPLVCSIRLEKGRLVNNGFCDKNYYEKLERKIIKFNYFA